MDFYFETLGCPKNLVDTQAMVRALTLQGHCAVDDPRQADVLIVNTCGFVEDARKESLAALRRLARAKKKGQRLVAAGCLSQYWGESLSRRIPGADAILGTRRWSEIGALFGELEERGARRERDVALWLGDASNAKPAIHAAFARQGASAYLKIADGCSAPCAFCAIPTIKGPAVSRPAEAIAAEAADLVREGVREIVLVAQDTTAYGRDRGEPDALPGLIDSILHQAPGLAWLRLMYTYPGHVSTRLIERMAADARICHYLDLPLQHAHPAVLRRMKRPPDVDRTRRLIDDLRTAMPDLAVRSTFIAGFPGETDAEFEALAAFLEEVRFDHVGVFCYSPEDGTAATSLPGAVPEQVKIERREWLMGLQQQISRERNAAQVGRTLDVLVEGQGDGLSVGRSFRDAPEVDGLVFFPGEVRAGTLVPVRISGAAEYDLFGEALSGA